MLKTFELDFDIGDCVKVVAKVHENTNQVARVKNVVNAAFDIHEPFVVVEFLDKSLEWFFPDELELIY